MVEMPSPGLMTAEELFRLPDDGFRYELVRGRLMRIDPSGSRSSRVSRRIGTLLDTFITSNQLGICGDADWGFKLASDPDIVSAPDVAFVRADRIPAGGVPPGFWPGAPDLAIEVVSPSDRIADVVEKVQEYLAFGARLVWVVDPEAHKAIVFRRDAPPEVVGPDGELHGEDVVPGFVLRLAEVWV